MAAVSRRRPSTVTAPTSASGSASASRASVSVNSKSAVDADPHHHAATAAADNISFADSGDEISPPRSAPADQHHADKRCPYHLVQTLTSKDTHLASPSQCLRSFLSFVLGIELHASQQVVHACLVILSAVASAVEDERELSF